MSGITYIKRIEGSTNSFVQVNTTDSTATATAANYITAQLANIVAVNGGAWTWQLNDFILLVASDGDTLCTINSTFTSLSAYVSLAPTAQVVTSASATPGTVRSITGNVTETATVMTSGNLVGVRGSVNLVGASGGFVYGTQGKVVATGTLSGSDWIAPVFAQFDISTATVNAAQLAPVWADYGASSGTITSATGMRMFAGTNTTAATLNSMIYLYGKASNLFELDLNGSTYISSGGSGVLSGTIKKIAFTLEGVQYYIPCATVIS